VSHIIPKFVVKQDLLTSATGFLRKSSVINKREQDGPKAKLLCIECEARLNEWETPVANNVYLPWANRLNPRPQYGPWMLKFAVSVSWRAMKWYVAHPKFSVSSEGRKTIDSAMMTWMDVLLGKRTHPEQYEQHVILFDYIEEHHGSFDFPPNINRFLTRGLHINMAVRDGMPYFIYIKMGKMTLLGFINVKVRKQWKGTKIHVKEGELGGNINVPQSFFGYLKERAEKETLEYRQMSDAQQAQIIKTLEKDPDKAANSELFQMMMRDYEMFGDKAFWDKGKG